MNIVIFIYSLSNGGAERVVSYLLPYLQEQGHHVHLVLMNRKISYPIPDDIPVHYLEDSKPNENGFLKFVKLPFLGYKYGKLLKRLKITHSFSLLSRPNYVNLMSSLFIGHKAKIIISERNYPSLQYGYDDLQSKINNFLVKRLYPKANLVIGNSVANVKDLIDNYGIQKNLSHVIQNPIDIEAIDEIPAKTDFFNTASMNLITVGRLESQKNYHLLLDTIARVPNVRLYILGQGILENELKEKVKNTNLQGRITFLGYDSNPYKYLKKADLFIFGSNHEGFPNVLLEAMCCGLPILTTNCKSGPDEIMALNDEVINDIMITPYGILTPVNDVDLMVKGLTYFIQNRDYMRSCKEKVKIRIKDFAKDEVLKKYETTLKSAG